VVARLNREAADDKPLIHYARVPFTAVCGADVPNQVTTSNLGHETCPACRALVSEEPR